MSLLSQCSGVLLPALQHAPCTAYFACQRLYATRRRSVATGTAATPTTTASKAAPKKSSSKKSSDAAASSSTNSSASSVSAESSSETTQLATAAAAVAAAVPKLADPHHEGPKAQALDSAMKQLNKKLGAGTIMRLGDHQISSMECIPSGCLTLDIALGGGWPKGRIVEIFGPESSGKSTLALHAIAEVQKAGGQAVLVDAEHAFNREFARKLGVNLKELLICQPSCGEEALEVVDTVLRSSAVDLVAVDSVAALLPRAEQEGDIGMAQVAGQARMMSQALRKLTGSAAKTNTTVIFINQLRYKVGVMFGNPEVTSGGNALKFYASQRVDVRVKEKVKGPDKAEIGVRVKAKVVKNKVAPPYRSAEFVIAFNKGIDANAQLLEACELLGIVQAKGSHYYYKGERLGQGRDSVTKSLAENQELRTELFGRVKEALEDPMALEAALVQHSDDEDHHHDEEEAAAAVELA